MPAATKLARASLIAIVAVACQVAAKGPEQRFLDGLRQRRLFSLVEAHCRERLRNDALNHAERVDLTVELIRNHAYHAVNLSGSQRAQQWESAHEVAGHFIQEHDAQPRAILVRVQQALTHLAHGELLQQEFEVAAGGVDTPDQALQEIRQAVRQLEAVNETLTRQLPRLSGREADDGGMSYEELFSLQNNVRFQLARAYHVRALCYPAASADRIDALTRAVEQHQQLLRQLAADDPLRWDAELNRIACERGLEHIDVARQQLVAFKSVPKSLEVELRARAEHVRLELAAGRPRQALAIAQQGRTTSGESLPDLDFAILQTYDALARAAGDQPTAAQWRDRSVALQELIERLHGPYWGRRATLLVMRSASETGDVENLQLLITLAEEAWRKRHFDDAVSAFERAAGQAEQSGGTAKAFTLYYKAALVEQERKHHQQAAAKLRRAALAALEHPSAPQAHLLAVWNAAQIVRADPAALPKYVELLEEHLATWPNEGPAETVRQWLARMREHQQMWNEALDIYLETSPESALFADAVANASRCAYRHLDQLRVAGSPVAATADLLAERFEALFDIHGEPFKWSSASRSAALAAGKLRLQYANSAAAPVAEYLQAALDGSPDADSTWTSSANSLLVVALAGQQGRNDEAREALKRIADGSSDELYQMALGLSTIRDAASNDARLKIAGLQLRSIALLEGKMSQLDPDRQRGLAQLRADALAAAGRRDEAVTAYQRLAAAHPQSGPIQTGYGNLLLSGNDKTSWEAALAQWRRIGRRSRPRSDRWFQSKYNIALAQYKLSGAGDAEEARRYKQRARQMLQFLRDTPPGWEASRLKSEFEQLLRLCGP